MAKIHIKDFVRNLENIFQRVEAGEEIIVFRDNSPIAKVVKFEQNESERKFGLAPDIEISEDFDQPLEDFEEYMP